MGPISRLMLSDARAEATVPAVDLGRARDFYETTLGLRLAGSHVPGTDLEFECGGGTTLLVWERPGPAPPSKVTAAHFVVPDVHAAVRELRARGVVFDEWDLPELRTVDGVANVRGRQFAWFHDPDDNILALHD
jgi:catechol 2,3-dioxygenase-like lactoylglutathione lyase family enzyme